MLFSSMSFLCVFLPIVVGLYFLLPVKWRNLELLLASVIFYAWGEPVYVFILLGTVLCNYIGALLLDKFTGYKKKLVLFLTIFVNLGILFYFKYFNFVFANVGSLFNVDIVLKNIIMPIGISFYTFQAISYLVDVYKGQVVAQKNFYKLALYITLFPQLIAGPIIKYHDISEQIDNRTTSFDKCAYGIKRFIIGLAKKIIFANSFGIIADTIFNTPVEYLDTTTAWLGGIAYTLQLFYDFSGYSDMAIGLCSIFGFKIPENFNYPYISKSITEFWRRWHISLSTWFKEYLYIPLGGNRVTKLRNYVNLGIVFLATGIWHGAAWTFVLWGIWHGIFIIFEKITGWHKVVKQGLVSGVQHIYTILIFVIGWVMFRADNVEYGLKYIKQMFSFNSHVTPFYNINYFIKPIGILIFILAILCATPYIKKMLDKFQDTILEYVCLTGLFVFTVSVLAGASYNPFIYFRF